MSRDVKARSRFWTFAPKQKLTLKIVNHENINCQNKTTIWHDHFSISFFLHKSHNLTGFLVQSVFQNFQKWLSKQIFSMQILATFYFANIAVWIAWWNIKLRHQLSMRNFLVNSFMTGVPYRNHWLSKSMDWFFYNIDLWWKS